MAQKAYNDVLTNHFPDVQGTLGAMRRSEISALHNFFEIVAEKRVWMPMSEAALRQENFRTAWNSLSLATRDDVAVQVANEVRDTMKSASERAWQDWFKKKAR